MRKDSVAPIQGRPARLRNSIFLPLIPSPPSVAIFAITSSAASRLPLKSRVSRRRRRTSFDGCPPVPPAPLASVRRMNVPLRTRKCCPIRCGQPQPQPVPEQSPSARIKQVSNANREPKARKKGGLGKEEISRGLLLREVRVHSVRNGKVSPRKRSCPVLYTHRRAWIALGIGAPEFSNYHV